MEKKSKILIFAGTTEGRELAEFLSGRELPVEVSVATEYGETLLSPGPFLKIHQGRMEEAEMEAFFREEEIRTVVDATHPYAVVVSENIRQACEHTETEYIRLLREESTDTADCIFVEDTAGAVEYLKQTEGNVLLTTGSKELKAFTALPDFEKRLYARVLSTPEVAAMAASLGFVGKHLICMQGPFSRELNTAMLRQFDAAYLVTKDSGKVGGFEEKLLSAREAGAKVILIGRPKEPGTEGKSFPEVKKLLMERYSIPARRTIHLIGIGMGNPENRTLEAERAIRQADVLIGAGRMLQETDSYGKPKFASYRPEEIRAYVYAHPEYERVAILLSGDVGFYSGAKRLYEAFAGETIEVSSGISSVVYFLGKLHMAWEDVCLMSVHGRQQNLIGAVRRNRKVFALVGEKDGIAKICDKLLSYGMDQVKLYVGERLSYPEERITEGTAESLKGREFDALSVVLLVNEEPEKLTTHGLSDERFLRAKVPMTKQGIRSISLSKLSLQEDSLCWDVGAGTGSVSIEMARQCLKGAVWAIEKKEEAVELLEENRRKFALDNLTIIPGLAPEALRDLPAPTHVFIGGSSGNLLSIMRTALEKNPAVRFVINAIALETVAEALEALKVLPVTDSDIVTAMIGEAKEIGRYHMMMGQNPVYVISCTGKGETDD